MKKESVHFKTILLRRKCATENKNRLKLRSCGSVKLKLAAEILLKNGVVPQNSKKACVVNGNREVRGAPTDINVPVQ